MKNKVIILSQEANEDCTRFAARINEALDDIRKQHQHPLVYPIQMTSDSNGRKDVIIHYCTSEK